MICCYIRFVLSVHYRLGSDSLNCDIGAMVSKCIPMKILLFIIVTFYTSHFSVFFSILTINTFTLWLLGWPNVLRCTCAKYIECYTGLNRGGG